MRKIEKLIYVNERGEKIEFSCQSKYHLNSVTGLSDVRNAIYSISSMGQDGDTYLGNRIESREIELTGSINTRNKDYMHELRRNLNRVLNPQYSAKLIYQFGDFIRQIDCKVDSAPIYSRKAVFQDFTVQLLCPNPFWREENETREEIASWTSGFEFPTETGGLEIDSVNKWEIGSRQPSLIVNVLNGGDVRAGIRVDFKAIGAVNNPSILNVNTQEFIKFEIAMQAGDVLSISTGYGEKTAVPKRNGVETDAFRYLDTDSTYFQLEVGDNLFRYAAEKNPESLEVTIYHNNLYLGV